jgi:hypothetical protein
MTVLLFVHGTGVRGADYDLSFKTVQRQVLRHLTGVTAQPCLWGDEIGAKLLSQGVSIPTYDPARVDPKGGEPDVRQREEVRWGLLYQDPLYELRSLAAMGAADEGAFTPVAPGAALTPAKLRATLAGVTFSPKVVEGLAQAGHPIAPLAALAAARLADDPVLADALAAPGLADPVARRLPLARAFVAAWANAAQAGGHSTLSGALRNLMYDDVVALTLGGTPKGIVDRVVGVVGGLASWVGTPIARRKRTALTDASYPAAADVLRYQAHGDALRSFIAKRIRAINETGEPVIVLAHSLGGIAAVELLAGKGAPPVAALVTVGSQAPFLYELDALATLPHGTVLPATFPRWLNVYDLNDMLSYLASGPFPDRALDVEVASRQPFPQSHSAYWANDRLWTELKAFLG